LVQRNWLALSILIFLPNLFNFFIKGIIESDDIKQIQQEIDKAVDFSKKVVYIFSFKYKKTFIISFFFSFLGFSVSSNNKTKRNN
jgi:hypothetical protein